MNKELLNHYLQFSIYTNPGLYKAILRKLPSDVRKIGNLVRSQMIHRTTLATGNIGTNADKKYGDITKVPWHRQPEDDILVTTASILAELFGRDKRGFVPERKEKDKLVLTCRHLCILIASILKSKGIPCRVRAGHAPYFAFLGPEKISTDHWINQYWSSKEKRWISIDVDGSWNVSNFDPYDIPEGKFEFPADIWLNIRSGEYDANRFYNAKPERGQIVVLWSLFYDFHCLMNDEVNYPHVPEPATYEGFRKLTVEELKEIDELAKLMQDPDRNFTELKVIWETNRKFRLLKGGLL